MLIYIWCAKRHQKKNSRSRTGNSIPQYLSNEKIISKYLSNEEQGVKLRGC